VRFDSAPPSDPVWLGGAVHNGFAAELAQAPAAAGDGAAGFASERGDQGFVVLAEDIQDPRNLGALLRVCEGAGAGRVLVRDRGSAPLSATAVKTSAGASEWLNVERIGSSAQRLEQLKKEATGSTAWRPVAKRPGPSTSRGRSFFASVAKRTACAS
jgi:tRNA G18 (ribose-2'-O)-methylase SpoU